MLPGYYNPSFDFELFSLPNFSDLYANEFGASSTFNAQTPSSYVDFSLSRLLGLMQTPNEVPFERATYPSNGNMDLANLLTFFQSGTGELPKRPDIIQVYPAPNPQAATQERQQAESEVKRTGCNVFDIITGRCQPAIVEGIAKPKDEERITSDGQGILGDKSSKSIGEWFKTLPEGSGIFLIAVAIIILLLLFVRR